MRTRRLLVILLFFAAALVVVWMLSSAGERTRVHPAAESASGGDERRAPQPRPGPDVGLRKEVDSAERSRPPAPEPAPNTDQAVRDYVANKMADPEYDWKQPINFYGKAVDENQLAVEGASVDFKWTNLSADGTSEYHTTSDESGFFSMVNRKGKCLSVTVSKAGYYSTGDARKASFEYANPAEGLFTPDVNVPVLFHLRKKGVGVDLITSRYGAAPDFPIHIPRDGTPVLVDLVERRVGEVGQLRISENKPAYDTWKEAKTWSFRMEIPGGGFVAEHDEFPFEAPATGYQPVVEFNLQQGQPDWALNLEKDYYMKFGNPPRYGVLHLQTGISMGGAILTYRYQSRRHAKPGAEMKEPSCEEGQAVCGKARRT